MWAYWLMFACAALGLLAAPRGTVIAPMRGLYKSAWVVVILLFTVMIGFRHEVGGDWGAYSRHFYNISQMSLGEALGFSDPGYYFLNWLVARWGGNVYWVNLCCAGLVVWGTAHFARQQPMPWLALLVAVPYLLIVVAMGYSRQGAALGLVLVALACLGKQETAKFVIFVLLGALFHKSAVLLLPIAALSATQSRLWTFIWVGVVTVAGAYFLLLEAADDLWQNYVEADYQSQGGLIRVLMNAVPAVILLLNRRHLFYDRAESKLWLWLSVFSLLTVPLVLVSSTATDRVALYFIPIQLFVFSRVPFLAPRLGERQLLLMGVVVYYALVQSVWLNYAVHAHYWLPYQNYLLRAW